MPTPFVVYADIVGDLFHAGHVSFLRKVRALAESRAGGDRDVFLLVGLLSDEAAAAYKRRPLLTLGERVAVVESCRYVDGVVAGSPLVTDDRFIDDHGISLVVHGDDMSEAELRKYYEAPMRRGIFATVPYTKTGDAPSTTALLHRIERRAAEGGAAS